MKLIVYICIGQRANQRLCMNYCSILY